jgi:negative regulator of genetic competence, sporulation and motility
MPLNPDHPVGGNKAKVFDSGLGYNKSNADDLMKQVQEKLPQSNCFRKSGPIWTKIYCRHADYQVQVATQQQLEEVG